MSDKVAVFDDLDHLEDYLNRNRHMKFCLYLAFKTPADWDRSTSWVYMNQLFEGFEYLPVNIGRDVVDSLRRLYRITDAHPHVVAINQTQPHKSNPVLHERYGAELNDIDTLVRTPDGFEPYCLNAVSFRKWFETDVGPFAGRSVVLIGVGGVGAPLLDMLSREFLARCVAIEKRDVGKRVAMMGGDIRLLDDFSRLEAADWPDMLLINAAGKEGAEDSAALEALLASRSGRGDVFVDLRPHMDVPAVTKAQAYGWRGYTGHGMNALNDHMLVCRIAELIDREPPAYDVFRDLVAKAS